MTFRIRTEARSWFKDLRERETGFAVDFDSLYFCFMAGISTARKADAAQGETVELVNYFPDRYKSRGKLLVTIFLWSELKQYGVSMNDQKDVHSVISRLVLPETPGLLSDVGFREFNKYTFAGFEVLGEWFSDRPRSLEAFLRMFKRSVDDVLLSTSA
jgi:hypothetical protein